ncbi:DUF4383 domain-containing protein [Frigidibacter sp. ROC022]|uniref:DUF4383 domain-containing protein n=1 Tax=Frigidibacter sp. ROC022 TaxID=2971796 RepID=UPI00215A7630|nr:DUF4383 domain-containing protein [Frigidibacter sp. ROC022]MCR8724955.1 DUF4383 domain-containing protein [Frigidibacter sp. ROC022]
MSRLRLLTLAYFVALLGAAALNYIPGLTDDQGRAFGIFALDIFDDSLHLASALWALAAALISRQAARTFLILFGALYLGDGVLGCFTGSGYLDFGIFQNGVLDISTRLKVLSSLPHVLLGGVALHAGLLLERR